MVVVGRVVVDAVAIDVVTVEWRQVQEGGKGSAPTEKSKKKVILSLGDHKYLTDFGHDLKLGLSNYDYIIFFAVM